MAQKGDQKSVKLLLETLAKFNSNSRVFNLEDSLGNTPIKLAHEKGHYNEISKIYQDLFVDFEEISGIVQNETQFDYKAGIPVKYSKVEIINYS